MVAVIIAALEALRSCPEIWEQVRLLNADEELTPQQIAFLEAKVDSSTDEVKAVIAASRAKLAAAND